MKEIEVKPEHVFLAIAGGIGAVALAYYLTGYRPPEIPPENYKFIYNKMDAKKRHEFLWLFDKPYYCKEYQFEINSCDTNIDPLTGELTDINPRTTTWMEFELIWGRVEPATSGKIIDGTKKFTFPAGVTEQRISAEQKYDPDVQIRGIWTYVQTIAMYKGRRVMGNAGISYFDGRATVKV